MQTDSIESKNIDLDQANISDNKITDYSLPNNPFIDLLPEKKVDAHKSKMKKLKILNHWKKNIFPRLLTYVKQRFDSTEVEYSFTQVEHNLEKEDINTAMEETLTMFDNSLPVECEFPTENYDWATFSNEECIVGTYCKANTDLIIKKANSHPLINWLFSQKQNRITVLLKAIDWNSNKAFCLYKDIEYMQLIPLILPIKALKELDYPLLPDASSFSIQSLQMQYLNTISEAISVYAKETFLQMIFSRDLKSEILVTPNENIDIFEFIQWVIMNDSSFSKIDGIISKFKPEMDIKDFGKISENKVSVKNLNDLQDIFNSIKQYGTPLKKEETSLERLEKLLFPPILKASENLIKDLSKCLFINFQFISKSFQENCILFDISKSFFKLQSMDSITTGKSIKNGLKMIPIHSLFNTKGKNIGYIIYFKSNIMLYKNSFLQFFSDPYGLDLIMEIGADQEILTRIQPIILNHANIWCLYHDGSIISHSDYKSEINTVNSLECSIIAVPSQWPCCIWLSENLSSQYLKICNAESLIFMKELIKSMSNICLIPNSGYILKQQLFKMMRRIMKKFKFQFKKLEIKPKELDSLGISLDFVQNLINELNNLKENEDDQSGNCLFSSYIIEGVEFIISIIEIFEFELELQLTIPNAIKNVISTFHFLLWFKEEKPLPLYLKTEIFNSLLLTNYWDSLYYIENISNKFSKEEIIDIIKRIFKENQYRIYNPELDIYIIDNESISQDQSYSCIVISDFLVPRVYTEKELSQFDSEFPQEPLTYDCPGCTMINEITSTCCVICGTERPFDALKKKTKPKFSPEEKQRKKIQMAKSLYRETFFGDLKHALKIKKDIEEKKGSSDQPLKQKKEKEKEKEKEKGKKDSKNEIKLNSNSSKVVISKEKDTEKISQEFKSELKKNEEFKENGQHHKLTGEKSKDNNENKEIEISNKAKEAKEIKNQNENENENENKNVNIINGKHILDNPKCAKELFQFLKDRLKKMNDSHSTIQREVDNFYKQITDPNKNFKNSSFINFDNEMFDSVISNDTLPTKISKEEYDQFIGSLNEADVTIIWSILANQGFDLWFNKSSFSSVEEMPNKCDIPTLNQIKYIIENFVCNQTRSVSQICPTFLFLPIQIPKSSLNYKELLSLNDNFPYLNEISLISLRYHWAVIKAFNSYLSKSFPFIFCCNEPSNEINTICYQNSDLISIYRQLIFSFLKNDYTDYLCKTTSIKNKNISKVYFDRIKSDHEPKQQKPEEVDASEYNDTSSSMKESKKIQTIFKSAFDQIKLIDYSNLRPPKPTGPLEPFITFEVVFIGEHVEGTGGPYRQLFTDISEELQPIYSGDIIDQKDKTLTLLCKTPNHLHSKGEDQSKYMIRPSANNSTDLQQFEFLGLLMGCCIRTNVKMSLDLPLFVWKQLVGENINLIDIEKIDESLINSLRIILNLDKASFESSIFANFTALFSDESIVDLIENGQNLKVTHDNRIIYIEKYLNIILNQIELQCNSIKRGISKLVPFSLLNILTGKELETIICGIPKVDIGLLKRHTRYKGDISEKDQLVVWFWNILNEFTDDEKLKFIKFCWAQERIPNSDEEFENCKIVFTIIPFQHNRVDSLLPVASTCFFEFKLPKYSSQAIMKDYLLKAIILDCKSMNLEIGHN